MNKLEGYSSDQVPGVVSPGKVDITPNLQCPGIQRYSGQTNERAERLYTQIKAIATAAMRGERRSHTLQPTAVANEAYIRLSAHKAGWDDDAQFMRAVIQTIRRVLVDHARSKGRLKRGGKEHFVELIDVEWKDNSVDVLELDELLSELNRRDEIAGFVVEAAVFGALHDDRIAELIGIDSDEVRRHRRRGRAWLAAQLYPEE